MAGKKCPNCRNLTFFENATGGACTKCGFKRYDPANDGKGGKGTKCLRCGKYTVFNGKCRECDSRYK